MEEPHGIALEEGLEVCLGVVGTEAEEWEGFYQEAVSQADVWQASR